MPYQETEKEVIVTYPGDEGTSVKILKYGATAISWKVNGVEKLWLSSAAHLDGPQPVNGGNPLVFPSFGPQEGGPYVDLPLHGLAMRSIWKFNGEVKSNPPTVQFELDNKRANPKLTAIWGGEFKLLMNIELGKETLRTEVEVENPSNEELKFQCCFHTYLRIPDIYNTVIHGFCGSNALNRMTNTDFTDNERVVTIRKMVDRLYPAVKPELEAKVSCCGKPTHTVARENFPDYVVWNPWTKFYRYDGTHEEDFLDFEPKDGYKNMVCVETGYVHDYVHLAPGKKWSATQILADH